MCELLMRADTPVGANLSSYFFLYAGAGVFLCVVSGANPYKDRRIPGNVRPALVSCQV